MTAIPLREESLKEFKDKVVVISGSARGIGAATVSLLHNYGAKVIHGDWDASGGQAVDSSLSSPSPAGGGTTFVQTDVANYDSVLNLFDVAWKKYGRVDVAISNAGVQEVWNWFEPSLDIESVKTKPPTKVLDVNLLGTLYFARVASVYLSQNAAPGQDKSLILVSSTAGFKETPGLFTYTASKHGVLGLLRSLRPYLIKTHNIRVNAICPWMTDTVMVQGVRDGWLKEGLPVNKPEDVARVMLEVAVGTVPTGEKGMRVEGDRYNGRAVFVEGGRGWDIEVGIDETEEIWLGMEVSRTLNRGQEVLGDGTHWVKST
ncbi:putative 3-hydroxyacyl-CoA dehydrogenase [Ilyonectria destructans]|nr:putative 3-hydroxyacyl-CoA dehydrogenase [Ilyonectria destructans]